MGFFPVTRNCRRPGVQDRWIPGAVAGAADRALRPGELARSGIEPRAGQTQAAETDDSSAVHPLKVSGASARSARDTVHRIRSRQTLGTTDNVFYQ